MCALLNHDAIDVIRRDHGGRIALDMSSRKGHDDISTRLYKAQNQLLIDAAHYGKLFQDVQSLLKTGSNINVIDDTTNGASGTALLQASQNGHTDVDVGIVETRHISGCEPPKYQWLYCPYMIAKFIMDMRKIAKCLEEHAQNHQLIHAARFGTLQDVRDLLFAGWSQHEFHRLCFGWYSACTGKLLWAL